MQQIAEEAGLAVQAIYSSVGSKSALVLALADVIDEEAGVPGLNAEISRLAAPRQMIAGAVRLTRRLNERCGDILDVLFSAAPATRTRPPPWPRGCAATTRAPARAPWSLAVLGAPEPGITPERAAAVISMMTSPASWRQLTQRSGWSFDEAETWLTASLTQLLLDSSR